MRHLLKRWLEHYSNVYWLIPLTWLVGGTSLTVLLGAIGIDTGTAGAKGNTPLISLVVGSSLTVISMLLSGSLVALTLTSNQFGPRLLRGFLQDSFNKQVLGSYLGLAAYGLLLLLGVCGDPPSVVPTHVAVGWLVANLFLLVIFIHRLIQSMIVERVLEHACNDIQTSISSLGKLGPDNAEKPGLTNPSLSGQGTEIQWPEDGSEGYILQIDYEKLARRLKEEGASLDLFVSSGDWLIPGQKVAQGHQEAGQVFSPDDFGELFVTACHVGLRRTPIQDERFAFERITEIALRALSPGVHDPYTAITSIERAGSELRKIATGDTWPPTLIPDADGTPRIRPARASVGTLAETTFMPLINLQLAPIVQSILHREIESLQRLTSGTDAKKLEALRLRAAPKKQADSK